MGLIDDEAVFETLGEAQRLGFLGAAPIALMIEHALQYVPALPVEVSSVIDVGAGGGLPGLVVALARPDLDVVLLDRRTRRTDFLSRAVRRLALAERVRVLPGDAATLAHDVRWRGQFGAAIARGLGSPAITAELCRGFVGDGGVLIVSEPPAALDIRRWPESGLASLGWAPDQEFPGVIRVRAVGPPPPGVPRRRPSAPRW